MDSNVPTPVVKTTGPLNVKRLVENYVRLRERKRVLEASFKDQIAPFNKLMGELEGQLLSYMQQTGVDSVSTEEGTAYKSTSNRCTIKDGSAFRQWVIENDQYELVDWRANANSVFQYISDNEGKQPPGLNPSTYTAVRFRSPTDEE